MTPIWRCWRVEPDQAGKEATRVRASGTVSYDEYYSRLTVDFTLVGEVVSGQVASTFEFRTEASMSPYQAVGALSDADEHSSFSRPTTCQFHQSTYREDSFSRRSTKEPDGT